MTHRISVILMASLMLTCSPSQHQAGSQGQSTAKSTVMIYSTTTKKTLPMEKITKTDEQWRKELSDDEFRIARKKGTERAFTGTFWDNHEKGLYLCRCCGTELFSSDTKYESGTGWPSFFDPVSKANVALHEDRSLMEVRTEVTCARCDAHLGHVFEDGPRPTGLRYCLNSASLSFSKR